MVPVPKKQRSARGVLLACHLGKIYQRIVRTKIQDLLPEDAARRSQGRLSGGAAGRALLFLVKMRKEQK